MRKNTWLETVTGIVFLIFVGVILYYSFYPFKVTTLNSIGINAAEYCRGDWVEIEMKFQKHMDIEAKVVWFIVDGIVYQLDSPGISRPAGENHIVVSKQVPHSILPGRYNMRVVQTYQVHPLHKEIVNTWNTPTFEVLGDDKCDKITEEPSDADSQERPVINEFSKPLPGVNTTPDKVIAPAAGNSAQPVQQNNTYVQEQRGEPQTTVHEEKKPIKDLIDKVKGLL